MQMHYCTLVSDPDVAVRGVSEVDDDFKSSMDISANSHSILKAQLHWQPTHSHRLLAIVDLESRCGAVRCVALLAERPRNEKREKGTPHTSSFHAPLLAPLSNQKRVGAGVWAFNGQDNGQRQGQGQGALK